MWCVDQGPISEGSLPCLGPMVRKHCPGSQERLVRNYPVGAVISVWPPEQADSCDFAARFGAGFWKILLQTYYILVQKDTPCGSNYSGLGVFPS